MIRREEKQEGNNIDAKFSKAPSTSSRQWSAFRNPRIVRVSRSFGGKDRHSKVCTVKGLRDRRIRLSVPTAIQLYDLQDKLGLGQPSKVIDWLLDNTKNDIDKLPPLPMLPGFGQFHQKMFNSHELNASQSSVAPFFDANSVKDGGGFQYSLGININSTGLGDAATSSRYWGVTKSKEVEDVSDKGKWIKSNIEQENQEVLEQKFFPNLLNNPTMPAFGPYHHWDASNLCLSQLGSHGFLPQTENALTANNSSVPLPSSLSLSSAGSQLFLCPPAALQPSLFPPYPTPYNVTSDPLPSDAREINHFQLLSSGSQHFRWRPFSLDVNPGLVHLPSNNNEDNNNSNS